MLVMRQAFLLGFVNNRNFLLSLSLSQFTFSYFKLTFFCQKLSLLIDENPFSFLAGFTSEKLFPNQQRNTNEGAIINL
jgi:hypothetical protein